VLRSMLLYNKAMGGKLLQRSSRGPQVEMATGKSPSGVSSPHPVPVGGNFPHPRPREHHRGEVLPAPAPARTHPRFIGENFLFP
jgi:hypothetical protein